MRLTIVQGLVLGALLAAPATAYIGPGAGFALLSSFMVVFTTILIAVASLLVWPFRTLWRRLRRGRRTKPKVKRFIVLGLDGQDPRLTDRMLEEGKLPNFQRLAEMGCYHRLETTYPPVSPVAWSSFATGVNPGKHNIFDFLDRDLKTYLPRLSSTQIGSVERFLPLGRWRIPLEKPELRLLRRSKPFWTLLGEKHVWSTVLRVPITFPPDHFYGAELSAVAAPDLLGTQGTFLLYTTRRSDEEFKEGGERIRLEANGDGSADRFESILQGPENLFRADQMPLELPLVLEVDRAAGRATVALNGERHELEQGVLSDWIHLTFPAAPGIKVRGMARMQLTEAAEHVSLYITPLSFDPENPAMPISHPGYYSTYLAKRIGPYSTLGLAEDTWALNEQVIDDATFLEQSWGIDRERRDMFFAAWEKLRRGSLVCVFDGTDRIQHMFWRYLEDDHPAARGVDDPEHADAIEELYLENDELVGKAIDRLEEGDLLIVCSDHGFTSFRRGINLNRWLLENGYLALKEGTDGSSEWLADVDWSRTRAYAVGLTGLFLNLQGRESQGIVEPGAEAAELKRELVQKMSGLTDPETGEVGINQLFDTQEVWEGPYRAEGQDLLVGYNHGYRVSWDCATGMVAGPIFEDNTKAWSGDHGVDPRIVPGVFFCNVPIDTERPALMDIAPTALELFGVEVPGHMDGKVLIAGDPFKADRDGESSRREKEEQAA